MLTLTTAPKAKPDLLVISAVHPVARRSGQQVRVYNKLLAFRSFFETTFLTFAPISEASRVSRELSAIANHSIVLPAQSRQHIMARLWRQLVGEFYTLCTGLKKSNYVLGRELSPQRITAHCSPADYDLVVYEYWHAFQSAQIFQQHGTPCVLDMHDVLWQSWDRQLSASLLPWRRLMRARLVQAYKSREEAAWRQFDGLIAISEGEADYVRKIVPDKPIFLAPMGIDLERWAYCWSPATTPRLSFYGSLGSRPNQDGALRCARRIMPLVWLQRPDAELWIVGANPTPEIVALQSDSRIHVTGFVDDLAEVLKTMTAVLCPWSGTYGFRSRLIEVMALGVPVVATPDAVYGMGLHDGKGLLLAQDDARLAALCVELIQQPDLAANQSALARKQVEEKFSFEATYGQLARALCDFARQFAS